jgi:pteridine reductase
MHLLHKTALVTGGAVRIGRAICEKLAAQGCNVVVHCRNARPAARDLLRTLQRSGVNAWMVTGDLSSEQGCRSVVAKGWAAAGALDILVNNAAVFHKNPLVGVNAKNLQAEMAINLFAPLFLTREFAARTKQGKVVNLLDRRITANETGCLPYLLSKKALAEMTRITALELAPGITVNAVAPGAVLPPPGKGKAYLRDMAGPVPLQRAIDPADVAQAVVFLLASDAVTGQVLFVDGGQHLL